MMKLADWGGGGSRERKRRTEPDGGAAAYPAALAYPAAGTAQTKPRYDNHDVLHGTEQTAGAATSTYLNQRNAPKTDAWGSSQRSGGFGQTVTDVDAPGGARKLTKRSAWQSDAPKTDTGSYTPKNTFGNELRGMWDAVKPGAVLDGWRSYQNEANKAYTDDYFDPVEAASLAATKASGALSAAELASVQLADSFLPDGNMYLTPGNTEIAEEMRRNAEAQFGEARKFAADLDRQMKTAQETQPASFAVGSVLGSIPQIEMFANAAGTLSDLWWLTPAQSAALTGAAVRGGPAAVRGAGDAVTGVMTPRQYAEDVSKNTAAGTLTGLAAAGAGTLAEQFYGALERLGNVGGGVGELVKEASDAGAAAYRFAADAAANGDGAGYRTALAVLRESAKELSKLSAAGMLPAKAAEAAEVVRSVAASLPNAAADFPEAALAEHGDEGYNTNEPRPAHDADADRAGKKAAANAADDEPWFYTKRYAYPKLNSREWDLLHYTMRTETGMPGQYLDKETKWLFADKKGTQVFALYGVGDGTDPTPLYASGGKKAAADYEKLQELREGKNGTYKNKTTLDRLLGNLKSK